MLSCGVKHPLQRDGKSQGQRVLPELDTAYVSVDERSMSDLLVFAAEMAGQVRYYGIENLADGDWEDFFTADISTQIARISVTDLAGRKEAFETALESALSSGDRTELVVLFEILLDMLREIHTWAIAVRGHDGFHQSILNQIKSRLRRPAERLVGYDKGATVINPPAQEIGLDYSGLSPWWWDDPATLPAIPEVYGTGTSVEMVVQAATRLKLLFVPFYEVQLKIVNDAAGFLQETLEDWPDHKPHIALFIAFLRIFQLAQDHINTLTQRHLDFYFKEVLRLESKAAVPDQVHLIFGLARNIATHKLDKGTLFKAGKDGSKKDLFYELDEELVLNKGEVSAFKTIFLDAEAYDAVHAAPTANSGDGLGGDFEEPEIPLWRTFGSEQMPRAEFGWAVSSPVLRLAEGQREIWLNFYFEQDSFETAMLALQEQRADCDAVLMAASDADKDFVVMLTGEKEWLAVDPAHVEITEWEGTNRIRVILQLDDTFEAVTDYDSDVHSDGLDTVYPAAKLLINTEKELNPYYYLQHLLIEKVDFKVDVKGVRDLVVQNQATVLKADSAFQPYGAAPTKGYDFFIGSREVFAKDLSTLKLNVEWDDLPTNFATHYAGYSPMPSDTVPATQVRARWSLLHQRKWKDLQYEATSGNFEQIEAPMFMTRNYKADISFADSTSNPYNQISTQLKRVIIKDGTDAVAMGRDTDLEAFKNYNQGSQRGFVRLQLSNMDLGHNQYVRLLTEKSVDLAKWPLNKVTPEAKPVLPQEPYTPVIKSISLDYTATVTLDLRYDTDTLDPVRPVFAERIERMFHIHPFGQQEIHPETYEAASATTDKGKQQLHLVPQWEGEGNLYIGISGLDKSASSSISLLFQVSEGSADPDTVTPAINWSYLAGNEWQRFETWQITGNTTNGLLASGLMTFSFPSTATDGNSILPTGYHWIRGTVADKARGIADTLAIMAQSGSVTFADNENSTEHLADPLPAEKISKLKVKKAEVKTILQPYASFDGQIAEADTDFYKRSSERLRHKDRAITIWDYETLVLDHFPSLYRVKCISHTNKHTQLAPGCVYMVVVSSQINQNAVNPLEPRASVNTLDEVGKFLLSRTTPFLKLEVRNPTYEAIQVDFKVKFASGKDVGYYLLQLNEDLKQFLTPWAYSDGEEISFEGTVHASVILDYVEEREYVDYLTDFRMLHYDPGHPAGQELNEANASTPMSILVSHQTHMIEAIETPADNG